MTESMKQPHEGVAAGTRRDDFLLSLDDRAITHRDALIALAKHLGDACLVGNPAPIVRRMNERIRSPQPGDLVVEMTAIYSKDPDARMKGLGILLEHREEWWETDEEWASLKAEDGATDDADRMVDEAWYIQYGPEPVDVCRWVNCQFTAIPIDRGEFSPAVGQRDGSGVTFTRDDLLGGLADSGFQLREPSA